MCAKPELTFPVNSDHAAGLLLRFFKLVHSIDSQVSDIALKPLLERANLHTLCDFESPEIVGMQLLLSLVALVVTILG